MKVNFPLRKIYAGISLFYDNNISKVKQILPKRGGISYIGVYGDDYPDIVGTINIEETRFSLLPLVLSTNPRETNIWAVGHFPPGKEPQTAYISGTKYTLFNKFGNGFCLYKRDQ
jgi:hypothetical protein